MTAAPAEAPNVDRVGSVAGKPDAASVFVTAPDGLRLHVREYGPRLAPNLPVVCLPGLARTAEDFAPLASALAADSEHPRRVIALDYRGRGRSEYDRNFANYTLSAELADLLAVLTALELGPAVFVGTSRGGLLTMLLGAAQPTRIAGVVLNDIGPVIETRGLMRIKSYVGKLPLPRNFDEGADILKRVFDAQFPTQTRDGWMRAARLTWRECDGRLELSYDAKLARTLDGVDERGTPPLWAQFGALAHVPMLLFRGALTDLLSAETVEQMRARRKQLDVVEVPDQGHPVSLESPDAIRRLAAFVRSCQL